MVYFVLFGGIALAALCFLCGFFGVAGDHANLRREVGAFVLPTLCAAFLGWCVTVNPNALGWQQLVFGAAYCAALGVMSAAVPRFIYRAFQGKRFGIIVLFRCSAYCAVVAALASNTPEFLGQLSLAVLMLSAAYLATLGIAYYRFIHPKSSLTILALPINYFVTLSVFIAARGFQGTQAIFGTNSWLANLAMAVFPLGFVFLWVCYMGSMKLLIRERESRLVWELQSKRGEESNVG
ncbi:MAG: hypothetical protein AAF483_02970 [Planctomycetota bacterium]